ncbi:MAG TPA: adenylyltransferase/cytidyltransferase family protein [Candidatus Saccharimonadales bacterium]|nr:adenylyltransferase/cytidyltransferase family protein [Candidatus Saccharimonadales bacterium]
MRKIGLFAGVFDPIHLGHTGFIKQAIAADALDKVYVLVEKKPKYKTCLANYEHRRRMAGLAIKDIPQAELYEAPGEYFPITSALPGIKKTEPDAEIFLLVGDDVAGHIGSWHDPTGLIRTARLIIAPRGKTGPYGEVSSLKIRNKLTAGDKNVELDPAVLRYCLKHGLY